MESSQRRSLHELCRSVLISWTKDMSQRPRTRLVLTDLTCTGFSELCDNSRISLVLSNQDGLDMSETL